MNEVVITGIGFATSIGTGKEEVLSSLRALRHGFVRKQLAGDSVGPDLVCGSVSGFDVDSCDYRDWNFPVCEVLSPAFLRGLAPHGVYAVTALEEALNSASVDRSMLSNGRCGLFCASPGSPGMTRHHLEQFIASDWKRAAPMGIISSSAGTLNFNLAAYYSITGANCGFVSACASASHAIGYAFDEINGGRQDLMLVAAAEDGSAESLLPFMGLRALSVNTDPDTASRPFDQSRDGFVGTGGAAALILESAVSARQRGVVPIATMLGWGQASDGFNVAAPHPQGKGIRAAMENCLRACGVDRNQIDWINAHATSTPAGDRAEALAIKALAANRASVSSTKGLTGHGLSYSGALEAAICALCIDEKVIPGNAALENIDPFCDGLNLPTQTENHNLNLVLANSSGFGGINVCHLFSQPM